MELMNYARVCVELGADASMPSTMRIRSGNQAVLSNDSLYESDPDGQISPSEPLEVNRPICSAVDSDESMPPNESGHDSGQAGSTVYPDYDALDSSAVSRAFAAAFHLESRDQRKEDELFARQAINGCLIANATEVGGFAACEGAVFLWVSSCLLTLEVRKLLVYGDSAAGCADAHCYAVSLKGSAARLLFNSCRQFCICLMVRVGFLCSVRLQNFCGVENTSTLQQVLAMLFAVRYSGIVTVPVCCVDVDFTVNMCRLTVPLTQSFSVALLSLAPKF
ncbi:hypothetical protein Nepgr_020360 [Nepenthes gracilis]|uniref:Uncharacterized protein n=1 Tax=Nepenthes gracilis TaxID=150966 RepID=A0AAD3SWT6_NEPGR|nr:hypothetical protein Nepgr_020360 [Nepenthes gracilis]